MARGISLALACAFVAAALLFARPVATPGPLLRDFEAYWSAGVAWNAGENPYGRAVWDGQRQVPGVDASRDEVLPFVGPPATLPFWSLLARLPYSAAARVWWGLLALSLVALLALLVRGARTSVTPVAVFTLLVLALGFGPMTSDLALGQIALAALLGATACVAFGFQPVVASVGAFVAYLQPNVALGLLSQLGRNRVTLALAAGGAAAYLAGAAGVGWFWPVAYAHALLAHAGAERLTAIQFSAASIAFGFGASEEVARIFGIVVACAAVIGAVAVARRLRDPFARFAAVAALVPLAAGFFHEHDLIIAFPAAAWSALRARGAARAVALAGTLLVGIDWLGLAQRPSGIAQSALLALAALCAFYALGDETEILPAAVISAALIPVFGCAAWIAATHPVPVWPDALGAFHAPVAATIAQTWHAEQQASGLLARAPASALLRLLSILGCPLLAAGILRQCRSTSADGG